MVTANQAPNVRLILERLVRWVVIVYAIAVPLPFMMLYALVGGFFVLGSIAPVHLPLEERAGAALYGFWALAGIIGYASVWYALLKTSLRPVRKWLVFGMASALLAFGFFIADWVIRELPHSREITLLSFWPLALTGPLLVSLCFFVSLPRLLIQGGASNR
ncbi:MAG: hypothetical protein HZA31_03570 [Opitutae bacterium]|nr:hypothetical protein [Opitutae bacterium]